MEEEKLPVVSNSAEELDKHKILMQTPWEILQVPVGSGGFISSLSSEDIVENLSDMGVEYIEVRHFASKIYLYYMSDIHQEMILLLKSYFSFLKGNMLLPFLIIIIYKSIKLIDVDLGCGNIVILNFNLRPFKYLFCYM